MLPLLNGPYAIVKMSWLSSEVHVNITSKLTTIRTH